MDSGGDAAKAPPDQASLYDMMERLQQMTTEIPRLDLRTHSTVPISWKRFH